MGYLDKIRPDRNTVGSKVSEAVQYVAANAALGYAQGRYRAKAGTIALVTGVLGKAVALLGAYKGRASATYAEANLLGNVGFGAYAHAWGAGKGATAAGLSRMVLPSHDVDRAKKMFPDATVLAGVGPKAPHGDWLSHADLKSLVSS